MDANIERYIELSFRKIQKLKENEKGEVWLTLDKSGRLAVLKNIYLSHLPYRVLKEKQFSLCPRIFHTWEDEGKTVVVEEYVGGETLLDRIGRNEYLNEYEAKNILIGLCDGLLPIHKEGIIHRDIKPSNLILQAGGVIRLIDFDAARTVKEHRNEDTIHLGTKGYAPPEQFGYGQTDERSDIYSIGVTVQKALPEDYNGYLIKILRKCAAIDPDKRYQNVTELKRAIIFHAGLQKWGKKLAFAVVLVTLAITLNISQTFDNPKEAIIEETSASVETPVLTEKSETAKTEQTVFPAETKETTEPARIIKTVEVAPIQQANPPETVPNKVETDTMKANTQETVMKCPQIIPPPKTEEKPKPEPKPKPKPDNSFVEELEKRNEERELARKKAMAKMMLDSLPPNWSQEQKNRALKEYLKIIDLDKYP